MMDKPKFYDLETLTQEDLNKLALERNTLVKENAKLKRNINAALELLPTRFNKSWYVFVDELQKALTGDNCDE